MKTYRVYFNCRQSKPLVWSYDEGPGTEERMVKHVKFVNCTLEDQLDFTKHPPDEASAWFSITNARVTEKNGIAIFVGFDFA